MDNKEDEPEEEKFVTRPTYTQMFKVREAKDIIKEVLKECLQGKEYDVNETTNLTRQVFFLNAIFADILLAGNAELVFCSGGDNHQAEVEEFELEAV